MKKINIFNLKEVSQITFLGWVIYDLSRILAVQQKRKLETF